TKSIRLRDLFRHGGILFLRARVIALLVSDHDIAQPLLSLDRQSQADSVEASVGLLFFLAVAEAVAGSQMIDQQSQTIVDFRLVRFDHFASGLTGERVDGHSAAVNVGAGAIPIEDLLGSGHRAFDHQAADHAARFEYLIGDFFLREAGEMIIPGDVVGDGDDYAATARIAGFVHVNGGVTQALKQRRSLSYQRRLFDVSDLFDNQLPVGGEVLDQLGIGGEGYHRHFVILFQPLQRQQSARLNLLERGADAAAQIHQQNHRKRKPVLAEMRDLLLDAVFE